MKAKEESSKRHLQQLRKFNNGDKVQINPEQPFLFDKLLGNTGTIVGFINEFYAPDKDEDIEWLLKHRKGCYKVSFGTFAIYAKACSLVKAKDKVIKK